MNIRPLCWIAIATMVVACGCSDEKTAKAAPPMNPAPATAATAAATYYETSGPIVVENQVDLLAQRDGTIVEVFVMGDASVNKGQLLARLDDRQLKADRDASEAKSKAIAADLKNFETEQKLTEQDLARDEEMYKANLITLKQLDHSRTRLEGVKFEVERERQQWANAVATLRSLELELEKTRIEAPFSGVVGRRYIRVGQRVVANDKLFWVTATDPLRVQFTVPDSFAGKIHTGDKVTVRASSAPELTADAVITMVSPVVDPGSSTLDVQAQIQSHPKSLLPGMTAVVRLPK